MKTLVLIDSDPDSRALFCECLMGQDWRVIQADDGETGLTLVEEHRPAAVVCDLRSPKRNGFKVCQHIREHVHLSDTRVVLTGVSRFASDRNTAQAVGANTYLPKPILPSDLRKALEECDGQLAVEAAPPVLTGLTLVRFWGVRGSIPSPGLQTAKFGGNTSCVEVRVGELIIVLDAGSGIRRLGQSLMREFRDKRLRVTMLITHTHWDHIQGFPFFIPAYSPKANVRILGSGAVHSLRNALGEQMQDAFFPVRLNELASHVVWDELSGNEVEVEGLKVLNIHANHPAMCRGYRICTPQGDVVYMPDHEGYERNAIERQKLTGEIASALIGEARKRDQEVVEFLRDADVVITDTQYDTLEYPSRLDWGHSCVDDVVDIAMRAGVRRLILFHHDPDHNDEKMEAMVAEAEKRVAAAGSPMLVGAAREGAEIILQ
jgi:phosphoribosyl 1,2-cyclic phosphodiesterase/ActR/RegA family two-component response regulator